MYVLLDWSTNVIDIPLSFIVFTPLLREYTFIEFDTINKILTFSK